MKHYYFEMIDDESKNKVVVEFSTESDAWTGYDGPMYQFMNFLKGCGFVFYNNEVIGVADENTFRSAVEA